jgi:hypothetical protein
LWLLNREGNLSRPGARRSLAIKALLQ